MDKKLFGLSDILQPHSCVIILFIFLFISCKKDAQPPSHYFGKVEITALKLPGTPEEIDVKFKGALVGVITPGISKSLSLPAEQDGKLAFYAHGSDSLLLDSSIIIPKNNVNAYRVAFSKDLNIYGFITSPSRPVSRDSSYVQLLNQLDTTLFSDPVDMEMFILDGTTYQETPTDVIYKDIYYNKIYPGFMYTAQPKDSNGNRLDQYWVVKFRNHRTGQYVFQPANGAEWTQITPDWGHSLILILTSDESGNVYSTSVTLDN